MQDHGSALDWAIPLSVSCAALSVIPVLPAAIWGLVRWLLNTRRLILDGKHIPIDSFLFWYVALSTVYVAIAWLLISAGRRRDTRRNEQSLDSAPMRFALCYATVREIDKYSKNHLAKHIEQATKYWDLCLPRLRMLLDPVTRIYPRLAIREGIEVTTIGALDADPEAMAELTSLVGGFATGTYSSWFPQIDVLRMSHPWFKLEPSTIQVIDAFNSLASKINDRLKDKKDLHTIQVVLSYLSTYLYSVIPELSSQEPEGKNVTSVGQLALMKFAEELKPVPPYRAEQRPLPTKARVSRKLARSFTWLLSLFSHENPLLKFLVWWVLAQVIVFFVLRLALHFSPGMKPDSTLIVFVIGAPLGVAATALASPTRKK